MIGLDGLGSADRYASVDQWLTAYEAANTWREKPAAPKVTPKSAAPTAKPKKLSYREQQEWEQMESAILAAEEAVTASQAKVDRAATAGHVALAEACHELEESQHAVERLYARWQELEAKRAAAL